MGNILLKISSDRIALFIPTFREFAYEWAGVNSKVSGYLMDFFLVCGSEDTYIFISSAARCIWISVICEWMEGGVRGSEVKETYDFRDKAGFKQEGGSYLLPAVDLVIAVFLLQCLFSQCPDLLDQVSTLKDLYTITVD